MKAFKFCLKGNRRKKICVYARTLASAVKTASNLYYVNRNELIAL